MASFELGEYLGSYAPLGWHIFALEGRGKYTTTATCIAIFPASQKPGTIEIPMANNIIVPEAFEEDLLNTSQFSIIKTYMSDDSVAYLPLTDPIEENPGREDMGKKLFFYLYSLYKLQSNGLIPLYWTLDSVALANQRNGNYVWVDTRLRYTSSYDIGEATYTSEIRSLLSSLSLPADRSLINYLRGYSFPLDDTRPITHRYLLASFDYANYISKDLLLNSPTDIGGNWIDVFDVAGAITLSFTNSPGKKSLVEIASNEVAQDVLDLIGVEDVDTPPTIAITRRLWEGIAVNLPTTLSTNDLYILQQLIDFILVPSTSSTSTSTLTSAINSILAHYNLTFSNSSLPNKAGVPIAFKDALSYLGIASYPEEYIRAWKVAHLFLR